MNTERSHCPRCGNKIPNSHKFNNSVICPSCSWEENGQRQVNERKRKESVLLGLWAGALAMVFMFVHVTQWSGYAISIVPLKAKEITGHADVGDLHELAKICKERDKLDCQVKVYKKIVAKDENEVKALYQLGKLLNQKGEYKQAVNPLKEYVKKEKKDLEARLELAIAYGNSGQVKESIAQYRYILKKQSKESQLVVLRDYVSMLIENDYLTYAKKIILQYRRSIGHEKFMDHEMSEIKKRLRDQKRVVAKK